MEISSFLRFCVFLGFISMLINCSDPVRDDSDVPRDPNKDYTLLNSFYNEHGGRGAFQTNQIIALEGLIFAFEDIEAGHLDDAKNRIDGVFAELPVSHPDWWEMSSNSHCSGCSLVLGKPIAYYGLRMLDQIVTLGIPENSESLTMTAVVAPCAEVTRPTLPNLDPVTVNLDIAPEILADDGHLLQVSTALFRTWVQSITGGLKVNLEIYTLEECTTVDFADDGSTIISYPNSQAMVRAVPDAIADETDFWWAIAPSGVPGNGAGYNRHFITGGMGGYGAGLPLFISDDAWFIRKPEHLGEGKYHEIEVMAYQPQWFQHEFMHHLYRTWPEFKLEETGHQWFVRNTWPSDFTGRWEPDYYAESITKRLLNATPSLAEGLTAPESAEFEISDPMILVGQYERRPVENQWHEVEIVMDMDSLKWTNAAGGSWSLNIIDNELWTGTDCPYGENKLSVSVGTDEQIKSIYFLGEAYVRL